jgi:phosphoglycerate dehydrogenase-like enzyme
MPIHFDRYEADHKSIAEFLLSDQLRDAVRQGAQDMAAVANATAGITKIRGGYFTEPGPPVIVTKNGYPRLSERVWNHHPAAAADEFGSGQGKKRAAEGHKRPQGGSSQPFRTLGKAADRIGDRFGEVDD